MKVITTDTTLRRWNYFSAPWKTHPEGCGNTRIANAYKVWYSFCSSAVLCTSDDKLLMDSFNCSLMPSNFEDFATKSKAKTNKWSSQSAATKVIAWQTWANNLTITAAISIWENKRLGKIFLRQWCQWHIILVATDLYKHSRLIQLKTITITFHTKNHNPKTKKKKTRTKRWAQSTSNFLYNIKFCIFNTSTLVFVEGMKNAWGA